MEAKVCVSSASTNCSVCVCVCVCGWGGGGGGAYVCIYTYYMWLGLAYSHISYFIEIPIYEIITSHLLADVTCTLCGGRG